MMSSAPEKKLVAGFATSFILLLIALALSWQATTQSVQTSRMVAHTDEVLGSLEQLLTSLYRMEAAQRGYFLSESPGFLEERDQSMAKALLIVDQIAHQTEDNAAQQARLPRIREVLIRRDAIQQERRQLFAHGGLPALRVNFDEGPHTTVILRGLVTDMKDEETGLLNERRALEAQRYFLATATYGALALILAIMWSVLYRRANKQIAARRLAEESAAREARYSLSHSRALTLFNAETDRTRTIQGTLDLLAEHHAIPVSAFYRAEAVGDALVLDVGRGVPDTCQQLVRQGHGMVGIAAEKRCMQHLEQVDPGSGLDIEGGIFSIVPAAQLFCPVLHHDRLLGVLALSALQPFSGWDLIFIERLSAQLAVALNNLRQFEDTRLLADQLRERGEEISSKNLQLEHANRMKSEFLTNMSHELRTPMNAIIGFSEVLKDGLVGELAADQKEYITDIHDSGQHLLSLINDILDLSKIEAGKMQLELEPVDLPRLCVNSLAIIKEQTQRQRVSVQHHIAAGLEQVWLDPRKTRQILYNLLSNAVKFTPEGASISLNVTICDRLSLARLRTEAHSRLFPPAPSDAVRFIDIEVRDTGIGISPADLIKLFEPFAQIDSSLGRKHPGTGLGLAMVRHLTSLLGGGMMVQSRPGEGSVFHVWLPLQPVAELIPANAGPLEPRPAQSSASSIVLIVEDNSQAAELARIQLQSEGYVVMIARSAEEGLRLAATKLPLAIVLDIMLPGMDGWTMLKYLKEDPATALIPVIVVSIVDDAERGFALGASQVLQKPVSQEALANALDNLHTGPMGQGEEVLVVDDDPQAVQLVSIHLRALGFVPLTAYSGKEAIELATSKKPRLIVLDLMMPDMSGFEVVDALRALPDGPEIPILILTFKILTAEDRLALKGKVQRILQKGRFDPGQLLAEVNRALGVRDAPRHSRHASQ